MVQRLSNPVLRYSELNETHTRYDVARAAPEDDVLQLQFIILSIVNLVVAIACFVIIASILRSKHVRSNSFNLYLLFTVIPDFMSSFFCFLTCAMSAPGSMYYSETMCGFQSWYLAFGFTANCWMNGLIVYQLHKMLRYSNIRQHYHPPTRRQVFIQACAVYAYAAFLAFIGVWNIHWLPHKTGEYHGFNCFPMEYDLPSTIVYWTVFLPLFMLLPIIYSVVAGVDIYRRKLLPPMGRRRTLVLYFMRLWIVFILMWSPFLIVCTVGNIVPLGDWVYWSGAMWSHFQGLVSAYLSTTKPDVKEAVWSFLLCRTERPVNMSGPVRPPRQRATSSDPSFTSEELNSSKLVSLFMSFRRRNPDSIESSLQDSRKNSVEESLRVSNVPVSTQRYSTSCDGGDLDASTSLVLQESTCDGVDNAARDIEAREGVSNESSDNADASPCGTTAAS